MYNQGLSAGSRILVTLAAFVVVVAGIKAADTIVITFLLSGFFAIIFAPPFIFMQARGLPGWLSLIIMIVVIALVQLGLVTVVANSVADFSKSLPQYQDRLRAMTDQLFAWLGQWGIVVPTDIVHRYLDPSVSFRMAANVLGGLGSVLSNMFLIVVTVIFMLFEGASFPRKLNAAFGHDRHMRGTDRFLDNVKRYMMIKTLLSLVTGLFVYIWLKIIGVDFALLWGLVAFLLNFVPNVGSIIAAVPAVLLALIQNGLISALLAALGYLAVNMVVGNVLEPRYLGRGLGLSTLVVFLSLVFWGWVLGPVGMLLSVPLTMMLKIAFEANDDTRWLSVLLGPDPGEYRGDDEV